MIVEGGETHQRCSALGAPSRSGVAVRLTQWPGSAHPHPGKRCTVSSLPETAVHGVSERSFLVGDVPVVLWTPSTRPTTGPSYCGPTAAGQHKKAPAVLARTHHLVAGHGFAAMAVDAPGHGGRPRTRQDERSLAAIRSSPRPGGRSAPWSRSTTPLADRAVPEWRGALDHLGTRGRADVPREDLARHPGRHAVVPAFEWDSAGRFLLRHLAGVPVDEPSVDRGAGAGDLRVAGHRAGQSPAAGRSETSGGCPTGREADQCTAGARRGPS
jgi:hypothetical protein